MSVDRPIIKKDAFMYLLGFHCAGAQLSEQEQAAVCFNTTDAASSNPESAGTASTESAHSIQGTGTTTGTNYSIPLVIELPDNYTEPDRTDETTDESTGEQITINISESYDDNTIGEAAAAVGVDFYTHSNKYSQDNRYDWDHPPGTYGEWYDCSSLVSRIYQKVFTDLGHTELAKKFATWNGATPRDDDHGWQCKNTETLADKASEMNTLICINTFDESLLQKGDIIIWKRDHDDGGKVSKHKWYTNHAALYVDKSKDEQILHITTPGEPMYYTTIYSRDRIRFVIRPSLAALNIKGLSIDHTKEKKDDHGIITFSTEYKQTLKISAIMPPN